MLVLSRKLNETIVINDSITVKVVNLSGNRVGLGIDAPNDIPIERGESRRVTGLRRFMIFKKAS